MMPPRLTPLLRPLLLLLLLLLSFHRASGRVRGKGRRYLVFSSVGAHCGDAVHNYWLRDGIETAVFDLVLVYYGEPETVLEQGLRRLSERYPEHFTLIRRKGLKWANFRWWALEGGGVRSLDELQNRYDAIWIPDDDMRMDTTSINTFFRTVQRFPSVQIASPSFTKESEGVWRYHDVHQTGILLRYTNFVENSATLLRPAVLRDSMFQKCLKAVISGCYLDFCFFAAVGYQEDAIAIVDAAVCWHPHRKSELVEKLGVEWQDHWKDKDSFERQKVPKEVYWWREPVHFGHEGVYKGSQDKA